MSATINTSSNSNASSSSAAARGADSGSAATSAPPALRDQQRFDRALDRAAERRGRAKPGSDESDRDEVQGQPEPAAVATAATPPLAVAGRDDGTVAEFALPSALAAPVFGAAAVDTPAGVTAPLLSDEQFTAALLRLQVPVNPQGAQQWQFSLAPAHAAAGPVVGVQLNTLAAGGPWQVTLQSPARDRQVLHANLDKLRDRLRARGAPVDGVEVGADSEGEP